MPILKIGFFFRIASTLALLAAGFGPCLPAAQADTPGPGDLQVRENFQPGHGMPVGKILWVRGRVAVVHAGMPEGFRAKTGFPLYQGDRLISRENGRISCRLSDGSLFVLIGGSELVVNQSVFDSARELQVATVSVDAGSGRFQINAADSPERELKTRTRDVAARAQNGDFIVGLRSEASAVTVLNAERLRINTAALPEKAVFLSQHQRAVIARGAAEPILEEVPAEEIDRLAKQFSLIPPGGLADIPVETTGAQPIPDETGRPASHPELIR